MEGRLTARRQAALVALFAIGIGLYLSGTAPTLGTILASVVVGLAFGLDAN